jgi:hypothetical protein
MDYSKPNPAARINRLTPDQREAAFMHCELVSIKDGVQWLASEFNLQTSASSLSKWLRKQRADRSMAERREHLLLTKAQARIVGEVFQSATDVTVANSVLISQAAFEEMLKDPSERDLKKVIELMRLALAAKTQEFREDTLAFNIKRFKFNAAPAPPPSSIPSSRPAA